MSLPKNVRNLVITVLLVGAASAMTYFLKPLFGGRAPLTCFVLATLAAAVNGGLSSGLMATGLSMIAAKIWFDQSMFSYIAERETLVVFAIVGVAITIVVARFQKVNAELLATKEILENSNRKLIEQSEALTQSNRQLQDFAYALSHDIQEPLRTIGLSTEHLLKQTQDSLDDRAERDALFIISGVRRMHSMVHGLLEYFQATGGVLVKARVEVNSLVDLAIRNLGAAIEQSGANIIVDPLPKIEVHSESVARVFENLIGNAIKYRSKNKPEIHVSAYRKNDKWIFGIKDNGIGIDKRYFEKIFGIFQRLHSQADFEGNGIGLALCRAIIERHRGHIWLESEAGKGSTFYFSLPAAESPDR